VEILDEGLAADPGPVRGAGDGLSHHSAHGTADKPVFHGAQDNGVGPELADCVENGVVEAGSLLRGAEALLVGLHIGEFERVSRAQAGVHELIAGIEQQGNALACADFEVVLALGADVQVGFEVGLPDGLAAAHALGPKALGAHLSPAGIGGTVATGVGFVLTFVTLEPGHGGLSYQITDDR